VLTATLATPVNTEQLRQSVKEKWLSYYRDNRQWLARMAVWGTYKGQRRPSSSFILATLSLLEPQLPLLFPIIVDLSNDPDRIVAALGLNFNPETELTLLVAQQKQEVIQSQEVKLLPTHTPLVSPPRTVVQIDADCRGNRRDDKRLPHP
jgi:hypothetical protein